MMNGSLVATLALGFALGLKHALDADHLVAISTIVGRERSLYRSSLIGAVWGLGHTASLFLAALAVIVLRVAIAPRVALGMEFCVGLMLMILGGDLLVRVVRGDVRIHSHPHRHGGEEHAHLHLHTSPPLPVEDHSHHPRHLVGKRPFVVGIVHGLAGSAALMLFVLGTISSPWAGLLYVLVFGAGTIVGMLIMSALISFPIALATRLAGRLTGRIDLVLGFGSFAFGAFYAWRVAVGDGLLASLVQ